MYLTYVLRLLCITLSSTWLFALPSQARYIGN